MPNSWVWPAGHIKTYKNKLDAIESSNVQTMKQASSYFTEIVAAFAAMFAIVRKYKKLPPLLTRGTARSICDIGLDDSFLQDEELAMKSKEDADEKLASFLEKAVELSKQKGKEQPFLVIMAPPNCKAVDFVIFCQDENSFVAVQVKSNFVTEAKTQNEQKAALLQAAKDIRSASVSLQPVAFLAIVGSNYTETQDLKADTFLLQPEDLVALIPPFCVNSRVSLQGCKAWNVRMREWKKMEKESKADPKHVKHSVCHICNALCLA